MNSQKDSLLSSIFIFLSCTSLCTEISADIKTTATDLGQRGVELPLYNKFFVLSCNTTSGRNRVDHWLLNGMEVARPGDTNLDFLKANNNNSLLIRSTKKSLHEGNYSCVFSNNEGQGHIMVRAKPEVALESELFVPGTTSINVIEGDNLNLLCKLKSNDSFSNENMDLTIRWFLQPEDESRDPEPINEGSVNNLVMDQSPSEEGFKTSILRITPIGYSHRAFYICEIDNGIAKGKIRVLIRIKDRLAALWPFLGIVGEVVVLCVVIFVHENRRSKEKVDDEDEDPLNSSAR